MARSLSWCMKKHGVKQGDGTYEAIVHDVSQLIGDGFTPSGKLTSDDVRTIQTFLVDDEIPRLEGKLKDVDKQIESHLEKKSTIARISGKPFKTEKALQSAAKFRGIDNFNVVEQEGGFVGKITPDVSTHGAGQETTPAYSPQVEQPVVEPRGTIMFSKGSEVTWGSRLRDKIVESGPEKATASQWLTTLGAWKKKGTLPKPVQDELEWSGIEDWLKGHEGKVQKSEVVKYLKENGIEVGEVVKRGGEAKKVFVNRLDGEENEPQERLPQYDSFPEAVEAGKNAKEEQIDYWYSDSHFTEIEEDEDDDGNIIYGFYTTDGEYISDTDRDVVEERRDEEVDWIENESVFLTVDDEDRTVTVSDFEGNIVFEAREEPLEIDPSEAAVDVGGTRFNQYILPGGKNYQELYITLPMLEGKGFRVPRGHGSGSEIADTQQVVRIRMDEREDVEGSKVLFVEEVQSDIAAEGRKNGWADTPNIPFKSTWQDLAIKKIILHAVFNDFDKVAWISGDQTAARYDLSKQVDEISFTGKGNDTFEVYIYKNGSTVHSENNIKLKALPDLVGKDIAEKIAKQRNGTLSGIDLKIGGEWATALYDKSIPTKANRLIKKFGSKVKVVSLGADESSAQVGKQLGFDITERMKESVKNNGLPLFSKDSSRKIKRENRADIEVELTAALGERGFTNLTKSGMVNIVTKKEANKLTGSKSQDGKRIEGFATDGKIYLVAGNIKKGEAHQVLMHEMGHNFLPKTFKGRRWVRLVDSFKKHKNRNTKTGKAVAEAYARVPESTPDSKIDEEAMAYYVTSKAAQGTPFHRLVLTYFKKALVNMGFDASILTPDDIVAMVEGHLKKSAKVEAVKGEDKSQDIRYSVAREDIPEAGRKFMEKGGFGKREKKPLKEKVKEAKYLAGAKFRQGLVDQFDSFHRILKDKTAWMMAHLTKSDTGALITAIRVGTPYLEKSGAIAIKKDSKSLRDIFKPLGAESTRFLAWIAAHRSKKLMAEGRENLFTKEEIEGGKQLDQGKMPDGRDRSEVYNNVRKEFEELGTAINKIGVETGLISRKEAEKWADEGWYVPFYRMLEETGTQGPSNIQSLVNQKAYKELKGGKSKLDDILSNTLLNWNHIISASLRNQAATKALQSAVKMGRATEIPKAIKGKNSVYVRENGREKWFDIDESPEGQLVLESLLSLNYEGLNTRGMKVMRTFKRYLTTGVTASPGFKVRNLFRDTIHAAAVTTASPKMWKNILVGYAYDTKGMEAGGGAFSESGYIHGSDNEAKKRLVEQGVKDPGIIDTVSKFKKIWTKYEEWGAKLENVNRAAGFQEDLKANKSLLEANFNARDQLDFSRTGTATSIRFISQVVPFLNARLQGLDKIYRSMGITKEWRDKKQQKQFALVAGTYAMSSVLLYLHMKDDDDYKAAEDWEKRTYHLFKIPGVENKMFRLPRPFEVGALAYMAESMTQQFIDKNAKIEDLRDEFFYTMTSTFAFNPIPQAFKPMVEVYANKDMFTGRSIENMGMKYLSKTERFKPWTSEAAKGLSKAMDKGLPDAFVLSPVQIQHLVRAYTGWLGATVLAGVDGVIRTAEGKISPQRKWYEYAPLNVIMRENDKYSKYVGKFYDNLGELSKQWGDIRKYKGTAKGQKLLLKHAQRLKYRKEYNRTTRKLSEYRKELERIYSSNSISSARKREQIKVIRKKMDALAKNLVERSDTYF